MNALNIYEQHHNNEQLNREIIDLAPWHYEVEVEPGLTTAIAPRNDPQISFINPKEVFQNSLKNIYPSGLMGKRVLDVACNCGGYSFWAKELGASECFGFDAREHWIKQANWLLSKRKFPNSGVNFKILNLYELPDLQLPAFDISIFSGIFYHLPDPILGLKIVADMTKEVMLFSTVYACDEKDGYLKRIIEGTDLMSGIYGGAWFPTGPEIILSMLKEVGFEKFKILNNKSSPLNEHPDVQDPFCRLTLWASKKIEML